MTIQELLAKYSPDEIMVQNLRESMVNIQQKRRDVEITFATNQMTPNDALLGTGKTGIVIWLPSAKEQPR